jgi:hypothetical protein
MASTSQILPGQAAVVYAPEAFAEVDKVYTEEQLQKWYSGVNPMATNLPTIWRQTPEDGKVIPTPAMIFYSNMPEDAACVFSLTAEVPKKRALGEPPYPDSHPCVWSSEQIQEEASIVRNLFPDAAMDVSFVWKWEDLYTYFDAHDLWHKGAWNLWRLVMRLGSENADMARVEQIRAWVYNWLCYQENCYRLCSWTADRDILCVFHERDWIGCGLNEHAQDNDLDMVRRELHRWHFTYFPGPNGWKTDFYDEKGHGQTKIRSVIAWVGMWSPSSFPLSLDEIGTLIPFASSI